jgi:hypothetical protein
MNYTARETVDSWFRRATNPPSDYNTFDNFIALWISFNGFFNSELYGDARRLGKRDSPSERAYLRAFFEKKEYEGIYLDLISDCQPFHDTLREFIRLLETITMFPGRVADMRPALITESHTQEFTDIHNFKDFILVTYQIRCNLFHGNKSISNEGDVRLVKGIFTPFRLFLNELYKQEGYLLPHE